MSGVCAFPLLFGKTEAPEVMWDSPISLAPPGRLCFSRSLGEILALCLAGPRVPREAGQAAGAAGFP